MSRPDRMRVEVEQSDGDKHLVLFDGKAITVFSSPRNVYASISRPGDLDEAIAYFTRDLHMRLPLAMLLVSRLPSELARRVQSLDYVEKTDILGAPAHHLAGQTTTVDFQLWVADGGQPLPQRVVLTYKDSEGEPQFRAQFFDWNLAPEVTDSMFTFTPPEGAEKIAFLPQLRAVPVPPKAGARSERRTEMKTRPLVMVTTIVSALVFLGGLVDDADARRGGGGGGVSRGGGGGGGAAARGGGGRAATRSGGYSRNGAAAGGSFSSRTGTASRQAGATQRSAQRSQAQQTRATQAGATQRSAQRSETQRAASANRSSTRQERQGQASERSQTRADTRTSGQAERTERQGERQDSSADRTESRQQGYTERTDVRQQGYTERQANRQDYARNNWDDDDWDDDWDDDLGEALVVGAVVAGTAAVVGAAVSSASTPSYTTYNYYNTLPCTPATVVSSGVTYYQCGATWYNQAYSGGSVTYVTVTPPPGY